MTKPRSPVMIRLLTALGQEDLGKYKPIRDTDKEEIDGKLAMLYEHLDEKIFNEWEIEFIESMVNKIGRADYDFSTAQLEKLAELYEKAEGA